MNKDDRVPSMAELQEVDYGEARDYAHGSPHLQHAQLRLTIERDLARLVRDVVARTGQCRTLEVGAGHGGFTSTLRRAGATVTVTEMSRPSVAKLSARFADDPHVRVVHDEDGSAAAAISEDGIDLVVFLSVLHHIPDYLSAVKTLVTQVSPGGAFYCAQDPMWYPTMGRVNRAVSQASYYAWRLGQGDLVRGLKTRARRLRGVYSESEPSDMIEYHVVRQGVDHEAVGRLLREHFRVVEPWLYWSTQSAVLQRVGEALSLQSTFGFIAQDRD